MGGEVQIVDKYGKQLIDGHNYKSYENSNFVSGDSPAIYDINTDLGHNARDGNIICDGSGNIIINISHNGVDYGDDIPMKKNEKINLKPLNVNKIKITHSGTDSAYRILVV